MITLNPFKKSKKTPAKADKIAAEKAEAVKTETMRPKTERRVFGVTLLPHITEKSMAAAGHGWYAFRVPERANKVFLKRVIQDRYGVRVRKVRIVNRPSKKMRLGRIEGRTPGFKKAMVKLAEGQSIELS